MAAVFQLVLYGVSAAQSFIGSIGVMMSGFALGLTDVDALTIAMARNAAAISPTVATRSIAVGILANTLLKAGIAITVGDRRFGQVVALLLTLMAAALATMLLLL